MIRPILGAILLVVTFNVAAMMVLALLPPAAGLLWVVLLAVAFYAWSIRPGRTRRRRLSRLRLRAPAAAPRSVALSCLATLLLLLGAGSFINIVAPEMDASEMPLWYEMLRPYRESAVGWLALTALIAGAIPMVEEFSFRGHIQRVLERRYGVPTAIAVTALLFMSMHIGVPHWSILSIALTLGIACGLAVHVFRSIWPAVLMHSLWNGSMIAAEAFDAGSAEAFPAVGVPAQVTAGLVFLGLGVLGWRQVLRACTRRSPAPPLAAVPFDPDSL